VANLARVFEARAAPLSVWPCPPSRIFDRCTAASASLTANLWHGVGRWRGRHEVVQANELLPRSVVLVAPTSLSARAASFRPEIDLLGQTTRVLVEQVGAIDSSRLGDLVGRVIPEQQWGIDEALLTVLGLR
jgi:mRNA interferase MazF